LPGEKTNNGRPSDSIGIAPVRALLRTNPRDHTTRGLGRDGRSEDAGAIVDGGTIARAASAGFSVDAALAAADSGFVLESTGDLVCTGDTGTNVGDIVLALRLAPASGPPM
jgi:hydroxypyruvate reductase